MLAKALANLPQRQAYRFSFIIFFLFTCQHAYSQQPLNKRLITIREKGMSMEKLARALKKQTHCEIHIDPDLQHVAPLDIEANKLPVEQLSEQLQPYGLMLIVESKTIFFKSTLQTHPAPGTHQQAVTGAEPISVLVVTEQGEFLPGATVRMASTEQSFHTRKDGLAILFLSHPDTLSVSHIGRKSQQVRVTGEPLVKVVLEPAPQQLGPTVVMNYYSGPDRLLTGNLSIVNSTTINIQPVANPISTLSGRIAGLLVTQTSGVPGAAIKMQLRGPVSIASGTSPLILIDRVPYINDLSLSNIPSSSAAGSLSPLSLIDPADIESMELLKDADATAIYGSRGANGVLLITTKRAKSGQPVWNFSVAEGVSATTRQTPLMDTRQYVQMRREALRNDGYPVDAAHAPDLTLWDTTRSVDYGQLLTGGLSAWHKVDGSVAMAGKLTSYRLAMHYLGQGTVFPGQRPKNQGSAFGSFAHASRNGRLNIEGSGLYNRSSNKQYVKDLTNFQFLAPNTPLLTDGTGKLVFEGGGLPFSNPYAYLLQTYDAGSDNLLLNAYTRYTLSDRWMLRLNLGYNHVSVDEHSRVPISSLDPAANPTGSLYQATTDHRSLIIEPQIERKDTILGKLAYHVLAGGSLQTQHQDLSTLSATGYTSDAVLGQPDAAADLDVKRQLTDYRYAAAYGRLHLNWSNTYIINLTARRDGSSRFGPGRQFGNFGALGLAWIFSGSKFAERNLPWLSFGKLRGSIGITGNDQIGDYRFRTIWASTNTAPYQGIPGFYPTNLANPNLAWEKVTKHELALELGFREDRYYLTAAWYDNRGSNQLIPYSLPLQTGFSTGIRNSGAVVSATGWELTFRAELIDPRTVHWSAGFNVTFPRNRLVAFPNLVNSSYSNTLQVGQSLNVIRGYRLTGIDHDSGIYRFADLDGNKVIDERDRTVVGNWDTRCFGGLSSKLVMGRWQLDLLLEFRIQTGINYQGALIEHGTLPGMLVPTMLSNQTTGILDRWQKPGDKAHYQRYTSSPESTASATIDHYLSSNGLLTDASFVRVRTFALSWQLPGLPSVARGMEGRVFLQAENLLTFSKYRGTDPETQDIVLPPLRTIAAGIQISLKK